MGEVEDQVFRGFALSVYHFSSDGMHGIMDNDDDDNDLCDSLSISSSDDSITSIVSSSSDFTEDATSLTSSSSSTSSSQLVSDGPLYELSDLMAQLPIKRGLSKYFQGKSQSFTSLSNVRCIEDLAKRETPYRKKLKPCKRYGGGLDSHKSYIPGTCNRAISKKASRTTTYSSLLLKRSRLPIPVQKNL